MFYLFLQTWAWILGAGLLGLFIGWLIWGKRLARDSADSTRLRRQLDDCYKRCAELESADSGSRSGKQPIAAMSSGTTDSATATEAATDSVDGGGDPEIQDDWKPQALSEPDGVADDLKRIKGVGPVIEKTLNELGIYHFRQVGAFSEDNIRWVDNYIAFPGRIHREGWVAQAQQLSAGGETDFSNRYDNKDIS